MNIVSFDDIRDSFIANMRRKMIIPVIGSGFTRGCKSFKGIVPSGWDYKQYMIKEICASLNTVRPEDLEKESFSTVSSIYGRAVSENKKKMYLRDKFTNVTLDNEQSRFLSIQWPYIYTLNIDDGIEKNSRYQRVVYANRNVDDSIFDKECCVIKLHGDVNEMLTYTDSQSLVFTKEQYLKSIQSNVSLLKKLKHDAIFQNMLYIGCSLIDEIDLMAYAPIENDGHITARYYCTVTNPSVLDQIKLEQYGITHCVVFESFEGMYDAIIDACAEAEQIRIDDLEAYKSFTVNYLPSAFEINKPYLLYGKSLIGKNREITIPYFFISRDICSDIIKNMSSNSLQFVIGSGCSGRTFVMADIACKIRDKDVFLFESKNRLNDIAFDALLQKKNSVILADSNALSIHQIEQIIKKRHILAHNDVQVVIFVGKNNRDVASLLKFYEIKEEINNSEIPQLELRNKFTANEIAQLNPRLTAIGAGVFNVRKTIVDNIIEIGNNLIEKNKYQDTIPRLDMMKEIAALIALATEQKLYSDRVTELDIVEETVLQRKRCEPLIDIESSWSFEKSAGDNSPIKYVINAEYWLYRQLEIFAKKERNRACITDAYRHIVSRIIQHEGSPSLLYNNKDASYKDYILFDNINKIFGATGRGGLALIRSIYDSLNDLLSVDPNYMHQRAKSYIKTACCTGNYTEKNKHLERAYRDASVAAQVFESRYNEHSNEKIMISIAHVWYTQALILCHKANANRFENKSDNSSAISMLHRALTSPYNSYEFAKTDSFNYQNVIDTTVQSIIVHKDSIDSDMLPLVEDLFRIISDSNKR